MKKTDLAYLAGFFDGEGSVSIYKYKQRYHLQVSLSNTNEWIIKWLKFNFGGSVWLQDLHTQNPNHRDAWRWSLKAVKATEFLKTILPYLVLKRPQAELALRFQSRQTQQQTSPSEKSIINEAERILMGKQNKGDSKK